MNRGLIAALLVLAVVTAGIAPLVAATTTPSDADNETDISPGEHLAAAVGSQGAELRGEVDVRVLETRLNRSASNDSKAVVLAETVTDVDAAIEELQADQERLAAQYENGTISFGEYAARSAQLVARERALTKVLNVSADQARELPEAALQNRGVSLEKISELKQAARNASGQAIAEIARQLAGAPTNVTNRSGGPPSDAANSAVGSAAQTVRTAEQRVSTADRTINSGEPAETLAEARATLEDAQSKLSAAREVADAGESERAEDLAAEAEALAQEAIELVEDARQQASETGSGNDAGQADGDDPDESEAGETGSSGTNADT